MSPGQFKPGLTSLYQLSLLIVHCQNDAMNSKDKNSTHIFNMTYTHTHTKKHIFELHCTMKFGEQGQNLCQDPFYIFKTKVWTKTET